MSPNQPLAPGTRLGVYEITALVGEGGMGQVYRATDTTLAREVAIKVLPPALAADVEMVSRFEREARMLAALNHPHIAAIYGVEQSGATRALVMELVEGEDLAQRLTRGAMPADEVWPIARQIAEALEAAHEQGIVHRDLKPANIKVRPDGTVKVLDFGIAKALDTTAAISTQAISALTVAPPTPTVRGTILGTPAYMAPEQAKGKPVDRRADIWAFGAVLFEMLSGQRAFPGEDATDTIAAVVSKDPNWSALPSHLPASIRSLLRRCLERDRKRRLDSACAIKIEMEDALAGGLDVRWPITVAPGHTRLYAGIAVLAAAALMATVIAWSPWRTDAVPAETRLEIVPPATEQPTSFALSPDGRQMIFVASGDGASRLWLRPLATTTAQPLPGTEGATAPFWSPDGRSVGFFTSSELKRLDFGGSPKTLAPAVNGLGATWNADGVILYAPSPTTPLMRVAATGGASAPVTVVGSHHVGHRWPSFLPDGKHFLFYALGSGDAAGIYLGALDDPVLTRLTPAENAGVHLLPDWVMWVRAGTLIARRLDLTTSTLTGDPVTVADGVLLDSVNGSSVSVATTGLIAYVTGVAKRQLMWVDRSGRTLGAIGDADDTNLRNPRVSPDGKRVVVARTVQGNIDLWMLDGPRTTRLTFDAAGDAYPVWSPDGSRIAFRSTRSGLADIYQTLANGAGVEERLLASDQLTAPMSWSADGRFILYSTNDPQTGADLWVLPIGRAQTPERFLKTPFREVYGAFSPDGQWVAYQSNESGENNIHVRRFVAPGTMPGTKASGQWQVSTAGGLFPVWRPDGRELFYLSPSGVMMAAPFTADTNDPTSGLPVALFPSSIVGGGADAQQGWQYDVAPDGRFLITTATSSGVGAITLVTNWHPVLKQ